MGFETCGPNEVMVVSGFCYDKPLMIPGGRVWVWPIIQQLQRISLNVLTLNIYSKDVNTLKGVPISCTGIAQVKIQGKNQEMLNNACRQLLGKSETEIQHIVVETLEGTCFVCLFSQFYCNMSEVIMFALFGTVLI